MGSAYIEERSSAKCKKPQQCRQGHYSGSTQVFDWSPIRTFADGDNEMQSLLVKIFIDNLERDLADLESSFAADNYEDWDGFAHKLYGSCSHMGAMTMAELCGLAQSLNGQEKHLIGQLHHSILQEYRKVRSVLQPHGTAA